MARVTHPGYNTRNATQPSVLLSVFLLFSPPLENGRENHAEVVTVLMQALASFFRLLHTAWGERYVCPSRESWAYVARRICDIPYALTVPNQH